MCARTLLDKKLARHGSALTASIKAILKACQDVFADELRCVVLCGSLLKRDFTPNYSDADIHFYVADTGAGGKRMPKT
jgi:predicted nucleotidyltransferase